MAEFTPTQEDMRKAWIYYTNRDDRRWRQRGEGNAEFDRFLDSLVERVTPRGDDWEYGCSWLEGQERVYGIRDDEWTAKNDLYRMNLGYPYPEENYLVRRHSATSWEPFTPTGKETE